jgi:uncharacterized membrane protein
MDDTTIIFLVFTISGMAEIAQGLPLMFNKIKPNWLYGFRLPGSVANEEIWYPVNQYMGKGFVVAGIILVISTLLMFLMDFGLILFEKTLVLLFLLVIPIIVIIISSFGYYKKLKNDR